MKSNFQILGELAEILCNQPTLNGKFLARMAVIEDAYSPPLFLLFIDVALFPIRSFHLPEGLKEFEL